MHLKDIEITNFRGFDHLKIEDFGQINVIIGKNNVGKTAFLEAVVLAAGSTDPDVLLNLNRIREHNQLTLNSFNAFFNNLSFANSPVIKSDWLSDINEQHTRITKIRGVESLDFDFDEGISPAAGVVTFKSVIENPIDAKVNRIEIETKTKDGFVTISIQYLNRGNEGKLKVQGRRELTEDVVFLPSTTTQEAIQRVIFLKEERLEGELVALLNKIDPRIKDIEVIGSQVLLDLEGVKKYVPLWLQGDGIKKSLSIAAYVVGSESSKLVLLDEIENGLHYSIHRELWQVLVNSKAQLFVTTHSNETLRYLKEVLDLGTDDLRKKVCIFDIAKTRLKGYKAYKYTYEGLAGAIENETEIRL